MLPQIGLVEFLLVRPCSMRYEFDAIQHDITNNDFNNTLKTWPSSSHSQNAIPVSGCTSGTQSRFLNRIPLSLQTLIWYWYSS